MNVGPWQLAIILVIILVLFGGAKLPQLARSLGEAQREFRKGQDESAQANSDDETGAPTKDD